MCHGGGVGKMTKRGRSEEVKHSRRWKRSCWLLGRRSNWFLAGNEFAMYKKMLRSLVTSVILDFFCRDSTVGGVADGAPILKPASI